MNQADGAGTDPAEPEFTRDAETTLLSFLHAAERVRDALEEALKAVGLSTAKFEVLLQLVRSGEALPLRVLAEEQGCVPSNITTLVDRLEAEGLVQRVDDPADRRSRRAQLTPLGESRARAGMDVVARVNSRLDATLREGEPESVARLLAALGRF
jgi:DNA-binding MarR family transcriptional regulator